MCQCRSFLYLSDIEKIPIKIWKKIFVAAAFVCYIMVSQCPYKKNWNRLLFYLGIFCTFWNQGYRYQKILIIWKPPVMRFAYCFSVSDDKRLKYVNMYWIELFANLCTYIIYRKCVYFWKLNLNINIVLQPVESGYCI